MADVEVAVMVGYTTDWHIINEQVQERKPTSINGFKDSQLYNVA